jgi:hypothetical protein
VYPGEESYPIRHGIHAVSLMTLMDAVRQD